MSGAMSDYLENKMIDFILRGQEFELPQNFYVGLFTAPTGADGAAFDEVSGDGYARVAIARDLMSWSGTQGGGSTETSSGSSGRTSNNVPLIFPSPAKGWGAIVAAGIFDAAEGGNLLWHGPLAIPKVVYTGDDPPLFAQGALTLWIDS